MVEIRPAVTADLPAVHQLVADNAMAVDGLAYTLWSPPVLVATRQGVVTGMIAAALAHPIPYITDLAIAPAYHRRGDGWRLIQAMELLLRSMGYQAWGAYIGEHRDLHATVLQYGAVCAGNGKAYVKVLT